MVSTQEGHDDLSDELLHDRWRPFYKRPWVVGSIIALVVFIVWFVPWIPKLYTDSISVTRLDAKGKPISVEVGPKTKQWVKIENVSKHLIHAIVVAEDGKFYQHNGFDFEAIQKAYAINRKKGRFVRGGSTISQQVVKMAFLSREKTYVRKIREALGTVFMELILPKNKILEWYINLTEFGGGVYGVKQAGQYYFRTRPDLLTTEQAIHLALVIPSPNKWSKGLKAKSLTPFGQKRFARIARNLFQAGYITSPELQTILARGNFGAPITGVRITQDNDDDDCAATDKECLEDDDRAKDDRTKDARTVEIPIIPADSPPTIQTTAAPVIESEPIHVAPTSPPSEPPTSDLAPSPGVTP